MKLCQAFILNSLDRINLQKSASLSVNHNMLLPLYIILIHNSPPLRPPSVNRVLSLEKYIHLIQFSQASDTDHFKPIVFIVPYVLVVTCGTLTWF